MTDFLATIGLITLGAFIGLLGMWLAGVLKVEWKWTKDE